MRETQELSPDMELPQGLGAAMARSPAAMERFAALPAEEQEALIRRARSAQAEQEMRACVDGLLQ